MDPPRFVNHYSSLFSGMRGCGLATPWIQKPPSILPRLPYLIWDSVLTGTVLYMLWCYAYSITTTKISFQDLCGFGITTSNYILGLLITLYFMLSGLKLRSITVDMDSIAERIMKNDIGEAEYFYGIYIKNSKFMTFFTTMSIRVSACQPIIYFWSGPVTDFFTGHYRTKFPVKINSPFDDKQPLVYETIVMFMMVSVSSTIVKKVVSDCLFLILFRIQRDFLKYLSISMTSLQRNFLSSGSSVASRRKMVLWTNLHQEILKNIQDLTLTYSPVIIFNHLSLICNIVCAAFLLTMKDNDNVFQAISVFMYSAVIVTYLFLISDTAHQLTIEIQNLSFVLYNTPWYDLVKSHTDIIKLILTISNRPIQVTAYRAPVFLLNRETFTGFIAAVVSAFVTFCQMKELYDE